jgi:hypothetical protein
MCLSSQDVYVLVYPDNHTLAAMLLIQLSNALLFGNVIASKNHISALLSIQLSNTLHFGNLIAATTIRFLNREVLCNPFSRQDFTDSTLSILTSRFSTFHVILCYQMTNDTFSFLNTVKMKLCTLIVICVKETC